MESLAKRIDRGILNLRNKKVHIAIIVVFVYLIMGVDLFLKSGYSNFFTSRLEIRQNTEIRDTEQY